MNTKTNWKPGDNLIYVVIAAAGGCDGLDMQNFPKAKTIKAYLTEAEAKKFVGLDTRYTIKPKVVNLDQMRANLRKKLGVVERLYLKDQGVAL